MSLTLGALHSHGPLHLHSVDFSADPPTLSYWDPVNLRHVVLPKPRRKEPA